MQNAKSKIIKFFFFVFVLTLCASQNSFAAQSRNLTIFAEPNMALALTKIARLYSQKYNTITSVNFGSSADLLNEVDSGEPADVFISAHHGWIESLRQKGLIDIYNIGYIANDELVIITSKSNPNPLTELMTEKLSLEDVLKILNRNKATLILDNESNSSGKLSNDFIKKLDINDLKLFKKLNEDKSSFLNIVKNNSENYALLLSSQIKNKSDFNILATKKDENIFYQALVIAGDNMEIAREFIKFLKSDIAKAALRESGFVVN